jgi:phosphoribosyl 1,2-cyclic phosphodiesterase
MIIDGGPGKTYERGTVQYRTTENLLQLLSDLSTGNSQRGGSRLLKSVDTVVVTHDDEDHKNGMPSFLNHDVILSSTSDFGRDCRSF